MRYSLALLAAAALCFQAAPVHALPPGSSSSDPEASASAPVRIVNAALALRGVPYESGGSSMAGLDCSGLVLRAFLDGARIAVPRGVQALFQAGGDAADPLHVADLLFFDTRETGGKKAPTHVGIYAGGGRMVHSVSEGTPSGVRVSLLSEPYYQSRLVGVRRLVAWKAEMSFTLLDEPRSTHLEGPFASREPLSILIRSEMTGGGPVEVVVSHDGAETLLTRVTPTARRPSRVTFVPEKGGYVVRVTRLFRGRELGSATFRVEE